MKSTGHQLLLSISSALLFVTVFLSLSYVQINGTTKQAKPFGLSGNYLVFHNPTRQQVMFDDVIDLLEDRSVLLLSHEWRSSLVGIYDPMMVMAYEDGAFGYGFSRYFSIDDYTNGTKSGIALIDEANILSFEKDDYRSENIEDLLYFASDRSRINLDGGIREIVNLSSLPYLGAYLYLDYSDRQDAEPLIARLEANHYEIVDQQQFRGVLDSIRMAVYTPASMLMLGGLGLYLLFAVSCYWSLFNHRRDLFIHYFYGASFTRLITKPYHYFFYYNLLGLIPGSIFFLFQHRIAFSVMSIRSFMYLFLIHFITTSLLYIISSWLVYQQVKKSKKEERYVR